MIPCEKTTPLYLDEPEIRFSVETSRVSSMVEEYIISIDLYNVLTVLSLILVMCSVSTNGERASLANLNLTIASLLECSLSLKSLVNRLS